MASSPPAEVRGRDPAGYRRSSGLHSHVGAGTGMVGGGVTCSYFYAKAYEDWDSDNPAGQDSDHVQHIRQRVQNPHS